MPVKTQAFKCSHCGMTSLYRTHVTRHENDSCRKNPDRRGCDTCRHYFIEWETQYVQSPDPGSADFEYKVSRCHVDGLEDWEEFAGLDNPASKRYSCPLWEIAI